MSTRMDRLVGFLREIGLPCTVVSGATGFLRGVRIVDGGLHIDPAAHLSNVIHEAGHLAVLPARFRPQANDDIDAAIKAMFLELKEEDADPCSAEVRAALQTGDSEATAWAWAVGEHLGLLPEEVIRDVDYNGEGESIRVALAARAYLGINGLACAGFCVTHPRLEIACRRPAYPRLAMWLQH